MTWSETLDDLEARFRDGLKASDRMCEQAFAEAARTGQRAGGALVAQSAVLAPFLSQEALLRWSETLTQAPATIYDHALDAEYIRTHIGGGIHRLFDAGHDIVGAWERVQAALPEDTVFEELSGLLSALWKDSTTVRGLPFATIEPESYERWAAWADAMPGMDRAWLADLASYDAFEILSGGLGVVGVLFCLRAEDEERLCEFLGSIGISSVLYANPLLGLAAIATVAYMYVTGRGVQGRHMARGAALSSTSAAIFSVLGLPLLVELFIALVIVRWARRCLMEPGTVWEMMRAALPAANTYGAATEAVRTALGQLMPGRLSPT